MTALSLPPVSISVYYEPADQAFGEALDRFLAPLKQNNRIQTWDAGHIGAGQVWQEAYELHLATDSVLILLLSPHFLASETCQRQMQLALHRQQDESAVLIPILVHPCLWQETAVQHLQLLPRTHKALSLETQPEASWQDIVAEISHIVSTIQQRILVIAAPEDQEMVERLRRDLAGTNVTLWSPQSDHLAGNRDSAVREAMRQATKVVLIASPAAHSSRAVHALMELAADYGRPALAFWTEGEDGDQLGPEQWSTENTLDARSERYEHACKQLRLRLKQQETVERSAPTVPTSPGEPRNPYKGLSAFTANDTRDFFGRQRFVANLLGRLQQTLTPQQPGKHPARLLAIVGASGSGKSSVVQAGLLPQLRRGAIEGSQEWIYLDAIVPGDHPLEALALSLAQQSTLSDAATLHTALLSDSLRALHLLVSQLVASSTRNVLLFIDQFEEIFTLTTSEEERRHFFDLLLAAVSEPRGPLLVLLTLRADFYEHPMRYPAFFRLLYAQHVPVLAMEREDLRQVIEGPANLPDVQVRFEENLIGDLLFDMREQAGALPLLQFTLDQLFAHRDGHRLTLLAYHEIGGLKGALTRHVEATYAELPSDTHRTLTRTLFLRLIEPGATEQDTTRRRATFAEFTLPDPTQTSILREVIDAFITARLLTANGQTGITTLEVSHEALIREWPRLIDWLHEAREDIRLQQTISKDVAQWQRRRHPKDHLYQGIKLKEAETWAKRNTPSQQEVAFLRASTRRRMQLVVNTILVVLLILSTIGTAGWFYLNREPDPTRVTTVQDNVVGSLRWAIATTPSDTTITFDQSLWGHTILLNDDLFITKKHLSIRGPEMGTLMISNKTHQIRVNTGTTLNISNLIFTGGKVNYSSLLYNQGTLTLTNSTISGNTATDLGSYGGGIDNESTLYLINSTIASNTVSSPGHDSMGGGIYNTGKLTLTSSTISGNTATNSGSSYGSDGGGIFNSVDGTLTLTNSTIFSNAATSSGSYSDGGGIYNDGELTLTNSTIFSNTATSRGYDSCNGSIGSSSSCGGGIFNSRGTLTLTNSTISSNTATNSGSSNDSDGGGIFNESDSTVTIIFSTIYGNTARNSGGISNEPTTNLPLGLLMLRNSLVAGNHASPSPDISGGVISGGYNLIQNTTGIAFSGPNHMHHTDITGKSLADLHIDTELRRNGGPTLTLALQPGSPAIDAIPPDACRIKDITTDQRGVARPQGPRCDIGAYEEKP